jgi:hypothetical protein
MGDFGVGKTSLIKQFVFKTFGESITSKVIARESLKYLQFPQTDGSGTLNVRLSINDIGSIRHPQELDNIIIDEIDGILLVCDLTKEDTFLSFDLWLDTIKEMPRLHSIMLVGNKSDISRRQQEVDLPELQEYAGEIKTTAFTSSARTGEGVNEVFTAVVKQCIGLEIGTRSVDTAVEVGRAGRSGSMAAGYFPGAVPGPVTGQTHAQRALQDMRSKYHKKKLGKGSREYVDSHGEIHLKYGGKSYIIKEEKSDKSLQAFSVLVEEGYNGLCIARLYPDEIKENYEIGSTPIYWLTRSGTDKNHLSVNLSKLSSFIKKFMDETTTPVILIEGVEYLIIQNDFMSVLKFIQLINEYIRMKRACLILPLNPEVLESRDLSLLEREMVVIEP